MTIVSDYQKGMRIKDIAKKYDLSFQRIYFILRKEDIPRNRPRGMQNKKEVALKAVEYYKTHTCSQLYACYKFGISYVTFLKYYDSKWK